MSSGVFSVELWSEIGTATVSALEMASGVFCHPSVDLLDLLGCRCRCLVVEVDHDNLESHGAWVEEISSILVDDDQNLDQLSHLCLVPDLGHLVPSVVYYQCCGLVIFPAPYDVELLRQLSLPQSSKPISPKLKPNL